MHKRITLAVLWIVALTVIIISIMNDVEIMGNVIKDTNRCAAAMEKFNDMKESFKCELTKTGSARTEMCAKDGLIIYYKVYDDGSKEWSFGEPSEKIIYNNTKKMCR